MISRWKEKYILKSWNLSKFETAIIIHGILIHHDLAYFSINICHINLNENRRHIPLVICYLAQRCKLPISGFFPNLVASPTNESNICPQCSRQFRTSSSVRRHLQDVHFRHKPEQCSSCPKRFRDCAELRRHVNGVHLKLKLFKCQFCNLSFAQNIHKTRHEGAVHRDW